MTEPEPTCWGRDEKGPLIGDVNAVAEDMTQMVWRIAQGNPAFRMKLVAMFVKDIERSYQDRMSKVRECVKEELENERIKKMLKESETKCL